MSAAVASIIAPERDLALDQLHHLFGGLDASEPGLIEVAWTSPPKNKLSRAKLFDSGDLDAVADFIVDQNSRPPQNVYLSAGLRRPDAPREDRAADADVTKIVALWADFDGEGAAGKARQTVEDLGMPPTLVVQTGEHPWRRAQFWWRLDEPAADLAQVSLLLRRLAQALGGDPSVTNPSRVMRLAGSIAWPVKTGRQREAVTILPDWSARRPPYALSEIERALDTAKPAGNLAFLNFKVDPQARLSNQAERFRASHVPGQWHDSVRDYVAAEVRRGIDDEQLAAIAPSLFQREGYTAEETVREVMKMALGARQKWGRAPREPEGEEDQKSECGSSMFHVTHFADIQEEHHKAWLIDNLLGAGEFTIIYGAPGAGKSVLVGDMAAHVAAGLPWFDRPVTEGLVVYVAAERAALVKRRLAAWRKRHGVLDIPLLVVEGAFNFCKDTAHAAEVARIAAEAAEQYGRPVVWAIIDTKAQVMAGADPNSDHDAGALIRSAALIQQSTGAHVTIVDHVPHYAPDRMKGSGAVPGASDGSFWVKKEGRGLHRMVIGSKPPNDGPDELDIAFALEGEVLGMDAAGKATTAPVVVPSSLEPVASGPTPPRRKLRQGAQKVFVAFGRLFDAGTTCPAPNAPGVKPGTLAVALAHLQQATFELSLFPEPEPREPGKDRDRWRNGRNKAWKRALDDVVEAGALRVEQGFAWDPTHGLSPGTNGDMSEDQR